MKEYEDKQFSTVNAEYAFDVCTYVHADIFEIWQNLFLLMYSNILSDVSAFYPFPNIHFSITPCIGRIFY